MNPKETVQSKSSANESFLLLFSKARGEYDSQRVNHTLGTDHQWEQEVTSACSQLGLDADGTASSLCDLGKQIHLQDLTFLYEMGH